MMSPKRKVIKKRSTADDAVRLIIDTAYKTQNSEVVSDILKKFPFDQRASWWNTVLAYIDKNTTYRFDDIGREQIKTPNQLMAVDKAGDCDDYSTLWLALCYRLGVSAYPKIVDYQADHIWDHVYVVVPLSKLYQMKKYLVLDNVYVKYGGAFNQEVPSRRAKVFRTKKREFYGID